MDSDSQQTMLSNLQHVSPTQTGVSSGAAKWKRQHYRSLLTPWKGKARASSQMNSVTGSRVGSRIHSGLVWVPMNFSHLNSNSIELKKKL